MYKQYTYIFLLLFSTAFSLQGLIITSSDTPPNLIQGFSQSPHLPNPIPYSENLLTYLEKNYLTFIVDATFNLYCQQLLESLSRQTETILLKIGRPKAHNEWTIFTHPSQESQARSVSSLIKHFEWTSHHVISSENLFFQTLAHAYIQQNPEIEVIESIETELQQSNFDSFMSNFIKPTGVWKLLVYSEPSGSSKILQAMENSQMLCEGGGVVIVSQGISSFQPGSIFVVEEGLEEAQTEWEYEVFALQKMIDLLEEEAQQMRELSNKALLEAVFLKTYNRGPQLIYTIINSDQTGNLVTVGSVDGTSVFLQDQLYLPGGVSKFNNNKIKILFSMNSGLYNYNGLITISNFLFFLGAKTMVELLNQDQILLPNFELAYTEILCGPEYFNYEYFYGCLSQYDLGNFHLHPAHFQVFYGTLKVLRDQGRNIPQIGVFSIYENLYVKQDFPELIFTFSSLQPLYSTIPTILSIYGFRNIIVIDDDSYTYQFLQSFYKNSQALGITIHNSKNQTLFPFNYKSTQFQQYRSWFQHYYDLKVKVVVLFSFYPDILHILDGFYEIGFRKGDLVLFCMQNLLQLFELAEDQNLQRYRLEENTDGAQWIFSAEYVDEYEQTLEPIIADVLKPYTNSTQGTCLTIDMLQLGAYSIDSLIYTGRNYNDPDIMNQAIREQRIQGCTGSLWIDKESNDRRDMLFSIGSIYNYSQTGLFTQIEIGQYQVIGNPPFEFWDSPVWMGGSLQVPSDTREQDWQCNLNPSDIQYNTRSIILSISVTLVVLVWSVIFLIVVKALERFQRMKVKTENAQTVMTFQDLMIMIFILVEMCQYIQLGPNFQEFNWYLNQLIVYCSLLIPDIQEAENSQFWNIYRAALVLTSVWVVLFLVSRSKAQKNVFNFLRGIILLIKQKLMPIWAYTIFVPLIQILLGIYECEQGISDDLTDSFLERDCKTYCWKENHLIYSVIGSSLLVLYIITTFNFRFAHHKTEKNSGTINQNPIFNIFRCSNQLIVVILNQNLKWQSPTLFNVLYISILLAYLAVSLKIPAYNYKRISILQQIMLIFSISACALTSIFLWTVEDKKGVDVILVYNILFFVGLIFIFAIGGIYYKKSPSVFMEMENVLTVYHLFRYMFGKIPDRTMSVYMEKKKEQGMSPTLRYRYQTRREEDDDEDDYPFPSRRVKSYIR